jgi:hypothetical protein
MSSEQPQQTLADYVTLVLSPTLIMGLAGSLVFFLLEILYQGDYEGRLQWILFFYVFGAVLIARLAILANASVPPEVYGGVLAVLVWLAMQQFVEYPKEMKIWSWGINLVLVAVVWWSAQRLTWDCTHLDEQADQTGEGLLQASGIEQTPAPEPAEKPAAKEGWLARYQKHRAERKKQRPLGVWVVYFSLAALPIFGLGQALIPADEGGRRAYVFWLMSVYVGSGLGLLLTTCFLSLRRYLRQRGLQMPAAMTGVWLSVGGGLVVGLLVAGALLPRPSAEYSVLSLLPGKSSKQSASKFAVKGDSPAQEKGKSGSPQQSQKGDPAQGREGQKDQSGKDGKQDSKQGQGEQKGDRSGQDKQQGDKSQDQRNDSERSGERSQDGRKSGEASQKDDKGEKSSDSAREQEGSPRSALEKLGRLGKALGSVASVLKWVVFGLLALMAIFYIGRAVLQHMAHFSEWAQRLLDALRGFWERLFGGRKRPASEEGDTDEQEEEERRQRFADFVNPFVSGDSAMSAAELVRYTFAAVQAWAAERGLERLPGETPLEFARRVGGEVPALERELQRLAALYAHAVYGPRGLPPGSTASLRLVWQRLEAVAEQPLSA